MGSVLTKYFASSFLAYLFRIKAVDPDEGPNGFVRFMLVDDKSRLLDLNPESGDLIFARYSPIFMQPFF